MTRTPDRRVARSEPVRGPRRRADPAARGLGRSRSGARLRGQSRCPRADRRGRRLRRSRARLPRLPRRCVPCAGRLRPRQSRPGRPMGGIGRPRRPNHSRAATSSRLDGITVAPFEWPGLEPGPARRDETRAWLDVARGVSAVSSRAACAARRHRCSSSATRRRAGWGTAIRTRITSGTAPTAGCWSASDRRSGCTATRRPRASPTGGTRLGASVVANVTGSVVVELVPPAGRAGQLAMNLSSRGQ